VEEGFMSEFPPVIVSPNGILPHALAIGVSSEIVDLLTINDPIALDFPLIPGKKLIGILGKFYWTARTGTATGNCSYSIGSNSPSYNDFQTITASITTAIINASTAGTVTSLGGGNAASDIGTHQLKAIITTAPTGVTVAAGYFVFFATYL
jgi:hypothetical protein